MDVAGHRDGGGGSRMDMGGICCLEEPPTPLPHPLPSGGSRAAANSPIVGLFPKENLIQRDKTNSGPGPGLEG